MLDKQHSLGVVTVGLVDASLLGQAIGSVGRVHQDEDRVSELSR